MKFRNPLFWTAAIVGILLDYVTKQQALQWVVQNYGQDAITAMEVAKENSGSLNITTVIDGVLNFTFLLNKGAAFGFLSSSEVGGWVLKSLSLVVSLGLAIYGWLARIPNRWEAAGYGFILGGAFGNGIERLFKGYVIDFIAIFPTVNLPIVNHPFPVFNVADIWINLGILCLLIIAIKEPGEGAGSSSGRMNDRSEQRREQRRRP